MRGINLNSDVAPRLHHVSDLDWPHAPPCQVWRIARIKPRFWQVVMFSWRMLEVRASRHRDCHRQSDEDRVASTGKLQGLLTDCSLTAGRNSQTKNTNWFSPLAEPGAAGHELGRENKWDITDLRRTAERSNISVGLWGHTTTTPPQPRSVKTFTRRISSIWRSRLEMIFPRLSL